ncbi:MAG: sensor histidine kinase [Chthoniobacteraceae bacterium]
MAARLLAFLVAALIANAQDAPRLLITARELRALSEEEARLPHPVRIHATVTLVETNGTAFLRDETGATFIRTQTRFTLSSGQRIEVEGNTFPGLYVTGIVAKNVTVRGDGELPAPPALNYEQLASGQFHYEWVEVRGIIRAITATAEFPVLKLALGDGSIELIPVTDDSEPEERFLDATVRVVGIAAGFINDRRQLVSPHLRLRSLADITILEAAPPEPAPTPASELLRFAPGGRAGHRVKVRGTVTHHEPGSAVYLRDGEQGLRVRSASSEIFAPGEIVEALGFPAMGTFSAELDDAALIRTGETGDAQPMPATLPDLLTGKHDSDLVRIDADVRDAVRDADRLTLTMQADGSVFTAILRPSPPTAPEVGARLRLTGVCRVAGTTQPARSFNTRAGAFDLLVQSIEILRLPPWWTAGRLAIAASALLALMLLALAWAALLRRQVLRQTALIRSQVEAAAVADERQRIAREFHDTLEQELVGVSLRLDAAATRAEESKLRDLLTATRRLVQQLQAGARSFVWNLRDTAFAGQPLAAAISQAVANVVTGRQFEVRTTGEAHRVPGNVGHELLRVAQEATANAVKHGGAQRVAITLDFATDRVRLAVNDDGAGFDPAAPVPPGHFGLIGMRERVQKLGGEFTLRSAPGTGTTLEVAVPLDIPASASSSSSPSLPEGSR